MTRFTCSMSSAIGASRLAALEEGVAVDDMMAELGSAANYKANRDSSGSQAAARRDGGNGWAAAGVGQQGAGRCAGRLSMSFDREANSMYNHGFPRAVRG